MNPLWWHRSRFAFVPVVAYEKGYNYCCIKFDYAFCGVLLSASLIVTFFCSPKRLDVQGNGLKNICFLRTPEEANYICSAGKDKNLVIIGASFLGGYHGKAGCALSHLLFM